MAFIKQEKNADPNWLPAIYLDKPISNDTHIVADRGVILVTRSIGRLPDAFNLEMCGDIVSGPWDPEKRAHQRVQSLFAKIEPHR